MNYINVIYQLSVVTAELIYEHKQGRFGPPGNPYPRIFFNFEGPQPNKEMYINLLFTMSVTQR